MDGVDKRGGQKGGSGRVAMYRATGHPRCFTLECHYGSARTVGSKPPASNDGGRASPPSVPGIGISSLPVKYTPEHWKDVGKACLYALLESEGLHPWSRLPASEWRSAEGARLATLRKLKGRPGYAEATGTISRLLRKQAARARAATRAAGSALDTSAGRDTAVVSSRVSRSSRSVTDGDAPGRQEQLAPSRPCSGGEG